MKKYALIAIASMVMSGASLSQSLVEIQNECIDAGHRIPTMYSCINYKLDSIVPMWRIKDKDGALVGEYVDYLKWLSDSLDKATMGEDEAIRHASNKLKSVQDQKASRDYAQQQSQMRQQPQTSESTGLADILGAAAMFGGAYYGYRAANRPPPPPAPVTCKTIQYTNQMVTQCF